MLAPDTTPDYELPQEKTVNSMDILLTFGKQDAPGRISEKPEEPK